MGGEQLKDETHDRNMVDGIHLLYSIALLKLCRRPAEDEAALIGVTMRRRRVEFLWSIFFSK
jgi:hypothetical protein